MNDLVPIETHPTVAEITAWLIEAEADEAAGRFVDGEKLVADLRSRADELRKRLAARAG